MSLQVVSVSKLSLKLIKKLSLKICFPFKNKDSYMAQTLVESMKSLSQAGKTVVCTIHQPSSQVFELFDT